MRDGDKGAPLLVLGPLLRYVGETEATIWIETDRACQVGILGYQARTFEVAGQRAHGAHQLRADRPGRGRGRGRTWSGSAKRS